MVNQILAESIDINCLSNGVREELAINIKNAFFEYKKDVKVLKNVSLQTPRGKIYALLGPSGSGKTTLIRAILGRLRLKSGSIKVFETQPGTKHSDIPGSGVGYMPQELAVYQEFTIKEILTYYGYAFHMEGEELRNRIDCLTKILNLPEESRPISTMSGGQKRRVSIAITMIHRPKLLILDEPTVGVDSLLRNTIWNYLEECCVKNGQTVLITTHYIEEAKSAANVAFMRNGTILKQSDPQTLLQEYNCQTLETVFLHLCLRRDKIRKSIEISKALDVSGQTIAEGFTLAEDEQFVKKNQVNHKYFDIMRMKAMLNIIYNLTVGKPAMLGIFYLTPIIILFTLKFAYDRYPAHIPMVVYNEDQNPTLSQMIIDGIDKRYIDLHFADSNKTAFESVVNGTNHISVVFGKNFSDTFEYRLNDITQITDEELESSQIRVYIDFSNAALGYFGLKTLVRSFHNFLTQESNVLGQNADRFFHFLSIETPIYGVNEFSLADVIGPGVLLASCHLFPLVVASMQYVFVQRNSGLERLLVSGVRPIEILVSFFIINFILIATQVLVFMFMAFGVFHNTQIGSYYEVFVFFFIIGLQGMASGFLIAILVRTEYGIVLCVALLLFPTWQASGVFWPSESIPEWLLQVIRLGPLCQPIVALRAIILKGWTISNTVVFKGFIVNIFYTVIISIINIIFFNKLAK